MTSVPFRIAAIALVSAALATCGGTPTQTEQGFAALVMVDPDDGIGSVRVEVFEGNARVAQRTLSVGTIAFPSQRPRAGVDAFFALRPGSYRVVASPLGPDGFAHKSCATAAAEATVERGRTVEIVLTMACRDPGTGGVDVVVTTAHPPVITDLRFRPSKFIKTCETLELEAAAVDEDAGTLSYSWLVMASPSQARYELTPMANRASFRAQTDGDYQLSISVSDSDQNIATLSFPVHVAKSELSCAPGQPVCDDGNACTSDVAHQGQCLYSRNADGSLCPFGACQSGQCVPRAPMSATRPARVSQTRVVLDKTIYAHGDAVEVVVTVPEAEAPGPDTAVMLAGALTGDVSVVRVTEIARGSGVVTYRGRGGPIALREGPPVPLDGVFSAAGNEVLAALYYRPKDAVLAGEERISSDVAVVEGDGAEGKVRVEPALARLDRDARARGGKLSGVLIADGGPPVEVAVDEILFWPASDKQLRDLLDRTQGTVAATHALLGGSTVALVKIPVPILSSPDSLATLRRVFGEKETLLGSPTTLALAQRVLELRMDGFQVAANPRIKPMEAPRISEDVVNINLPMQLMPASCMTTGTPCLLNVPGLWAFTQLWDADFNGSNRLIPTTFLDSGFVTPGIALDIRPGGTQCTALGTGITCGPGMAEGPSAPGIAVPLGWHGTSSVTVAGGLLNNGAAAGVAGGMMLPQMIRFDELSFLFEMGAGISAAAAMGTSGISISAGYPCNIRTTILPDVDVCVPGGRDFLCVGISAALSFAAAAVCATVPLLHLIPVVGPIVAAAAQVTCDAGIVAAIASAPACWGFFEGAVGNLRSSMVDGVDRATAAGVPIVVSAGNVFNVSDWPPELQGLVRGVDPCSTDDWRVIPAVLPNTIAVGSVEGTSPSSLLLNTGCFGSSVDVWAPEGSSFFAPFDTTALPTSPSSSRKQTATGTSAAAPYVAGVIAAMQALNPTLDPLRAPLSMRPAIPGRLTRLLTDTAFVPASTPSLPPDPNRRNLVNPLGAVRAAFTEVFAALGTLGYDTRLNFDDGVDDDIARPRLIALEATARGTILAERDPSGAVVRSDVDFYRVDLRVGPADERSQTTFHLRMPRPETFGRLTLTGLDLVGAPETRVISENETELVFTAHTGMGGPVVFAVRGLTPGDDNVYKLTVDRPVLFATTRDRLEPNDTAETATALGGATFPWRLVSDGLSSQEWELRIDGLSFHGPTDEDWFDVTVVPPFNPRSFPDRPGCLTMMEISYRFDEAYRGESQSPSGGLVEWTRSPSVFDERLSAAHLGKEPLKFRLTPAAGAMAAHYSLVLRFRALTAFGADLCAIPRAGP